MKKHCLHPQFFLRGQPLCLQELRNDHGNDDAEVPSTVSGVFLQASDIVLPNLKCRWWKSNHECLHLNVTDRCILISELIEKEKNMHLNR